MAATAYLVETCTMSGFHISYLITDDPFPAIEGYNFTRVVKRMDGFSWSEARKKLVESFKTEPYYEQVKGL